MQAGKLPIGRCLATLEASRLAPDAGDRVAPIPRRTVKKGRKDMDDPKDWLANAGEGVSRRQFVAGAAATGAGLAWRRKQAFASPSAKGPSARSP